MKKPNGFQENQTDNEETEWKNEKPKKPDIDIEIDNDIDIEIDNDIVVDKKLKEVIKYYEDNITLVLPATAPDLIEITEKFEKEMIFKAIDISCKKNKRNLSYIEGILNDWERKGYKTLADIQEEKKSKDDDTEKRVKEALGGK